MPGFTSVAPSRWRNNASANFLGKNRFTNGLAAATLRMRPASSCRRGVLRVACEKVQKIGRLTVRHVKLQILLLIGHSLRVNGRFNPYIGMLSDLPAN
jgi:hypothetical protein